LSPTAEPPLVKSTLNLYVLRSAAAGALGGLLFGFDTAVIAGATRALTAEYSLSPGAVGTGACLAGVAAVFATGRHGNYLVWLLVTYIAFFAFSQGAVIWVYISEVFPNLVRAKGQGLGSFTHWIMNALISAVFPVMAVSSGSAPFVFFACMMAAQFVVVWLWYPETKGVSLEALEKRLETR